MVRLLTLGVILTLSVCTIAKPNKIVCYYGSWAVYRKGDGAFPVEHIDPHKCTHLIYAFVGISEDASIRILDKWNDIDQGGFRRFNNLKKQNRELKTLVAIGGWNEGSKKFSRVAGSASLRTKFAKNALAFIRKHGFDGFDLDWEYPAQRGGSSADKKNVILMLNALRKTFNASGKKYLLTAAVAADPDSVDRSYDIAAFARPLDFINLMEYDFHSGSDRTGHNAPLHSSRESDIDKSVKHWIAGGAPTKKLVLGMPVYGRTYSVHDTSNLKDNHGLNIPGSTGKKGPWTDEAGLLGYNEYCTMKKRGGWHESWDDKAKVPTSYKGNQWLSFDNERSIRLKAKYVVQKNLGGAMIWSIDTDDSQAACGKRYPILSVINKVIFDGEDTS